MTRPRIKQSFTDWSFTGGISERDVAALYREAARIGYCAVEMAPPHRWDVARQAGLALLNIAGPGMDQGLNNPKNHSALLEQISALIETAAQKDISQLVVFSGKRDGMTDPHGIEHCATALRSLASLAEKGNVTLLLELLGQECHPDYQADNISFGVSVVRAVNSPAVKLLYDIYHMHSMGEAVIPAIADHLDCIGHLHAASPTARGEPVATDDLPHASIVRKVTEAGYRGVWGHEFYASGDAVEALGRTFSLFDSFV